MNIEGFAPNAFPQCHHSHRNVMLIWYSPNQMCDHIWLCRECGRVWNEYRIKGTWYDIPYITDPDWTTVRAFVEYVTT